jgi:hypothetical protein
MRAWFASALVLVSFGFAACGGGEPAPNTAATAPAASVAASAPASAPSASAAPVASSSAAPVASSSASASAAPAASASAAPVAVPSAWAEDLPLGQKVAFMKAVVMPKMKPVFQEHDAKEFADFSCATCHGKPAKDPHEVLPKLTMKKGQITAFTDKKLAKDAKWMAEKVVPAMAEAFGKKPFDPKTKEGFGCMGCHSIEGMAAPKADASKPAGSAAPASKPAGSAAPASK